MLFDERAGQILEPPDLSREDSADDVLEVSPCGRFQKVLRLLMQFNEQTGGFGLRISHRGYDRETGREVNWNTISLFGLAAGTLASKAAQRKLLFRRLKLYQRLRHHNFVSVVHSWVDRRARLLIYISDKVAGGTLASHLAKIRTPKQAIVKGWCLQLLEALAHFHAISGEGAFLYLRSAQVLVNANTNELKLSEEGFLCDAVRLYKSAYFGIGLTDLGCPEWIPPQMASWNIGGHTDVYCFGMLLLEVLCKCQPYSGCSNPAEIYRLIAEGVLPPQIESVEDSDMKNVVLQCLGPYESRPTIEQLLGMGLWKHQSLRTQTLPAIKSPIMKCGSINGSQVSGMSSGSERSSMANIEHDVRVGNSTVTINFQAPQLGFKCFKIRADNVPNFGTLFQEVVLHVERLLENPKMAFNEDGAGCTSLKQENRMDSSKSPRSDKPLKHSSKQRCLFEMGKQLESPCSKLERKIMLESLRNIKQSVLVDDNRYEFFIQRLFHPQTRFVSFSDATQNNDAWTKPTLPAVDASAKVVVNECPSISINGQVSPLSQTGISSNKPISSKPSVTTRKTIFVSPSKRLLFDVNRH